MWVRIRQSRAAVARIISSYDFIISGIVGGANPAPLLFCLRGCFVGFGVALLYPVGNHRRGLVRVDKDFEQVFGFLFQPPQPACEVGGVFLLRRCRKPEPYAAKCGGHFGDQFLAGIAGRTEKPGHIPVEPRRVARAVGDLIRNFG